MHTNGYMWVLSCTELLLFPLQLKEQTSRQIEAVNDTFTSVRYQLVQGKGSSGNSTNESNAGTALANEKLGKETSLVSFWTSTHFNLKTRDMSKLLNGLFPNNIFKAPGNSENLCDSSYKESSCHSSRDLIRARMFRMFNFYDHFNLRISGSKL